MDAFWARFMERQFIPQVRGFCDAILGRVAGAFADVECEAERLAEQRYAEMLAQIAGPDEDEFALAERAFDEGVMYYGLVDGVRRGLMALAAVGLSHLREQQLQLIHRKHLLKPWEEDDPKLLEFKEIEKRLLESGIELTGLRAWQKTEELRLLANTVKHGDGASATRLKALRPDLFVDPADLPATAPRQVSIPLGGEAVFVTDQVLREYAEAVVDFWEEFAERWRHA